MTATMQHPSIIDDTITQAEQVQYGLLFDVSDEARRLRFMHDVLVTREVWDECVWWDDLIEARKTGTTAEETVSRLRDLLWSALLAAKRSRGSRTYFNLDRVPVWGKGTQARPITLAMSIGPGDDLRPVITIEIPKG